MLLDDRFPFLDRFIGIEALGVVMTLDNNGGPRGRSPRMGLRSIATRLLMAATLTSALALPFGVFAASAQTADEEQQAARQQRYIDEFEGRLAALERQQANGDCLSYESNRQVLASMGVSARLPDGFRRRAGERLANILNRGCMPRTGGERGDVFLQRLARLVQDARSANSSHHSASQRCDVESRRHWSREIERIWRDTSTMNPDSITAGSAEWRSGLGEVDRLWRTVWVRELPADCTPARIAAATAPADDQLRVPVAAPRPIAVTQMPDPPPVANAGRQDVLAAHARNITAAFAARRAGFRAAAAGCAAAPFGQARIAYLDELGTAIQRAERGGRSTEGFSAALHQEQRAVWATPVPNCVRTAAAQAPSATRASPPAPAPVAGSARSSASGCRGFAGTWDLGGGATLWMQQRGDQASGTYIFAGGDGTVEGTVTGGRFNGRYTGIYEVGRAAGSMTLQLAPDGNTFGGSFERTSGTGPSGGWSARCVAPPRPEPVPQPPRLVREAQSPVSLTRLRALAVLAAEAGSRHRVATHRCDRVSMERERLEIERASREFSQIDRGNIEYSVWSGLSDRIDHERSQASRRQPTNCGSRLGPASAAGSQALEAAVARDSLGWRSNRYSAGSMRNVGLVDGSETSGNFALRGDYTYNGNLTGWVIARFQDGRLHCLQYHDTGRACRAPH